MAAVRVPSDIALVEQKLTVGERPLTFFERTGLCLTPGFIFRKSYSKLSRDEMRQILTRRLGLVNNIPNAPSVLDILQTRQQGIHKKVISTNYKVGGAFGSTGLGAYLLRYYDYKTKLIVLPFLFYGGSWVGRWTGDLVTGRWSSNGRERYLASLPAHSWLS